MKLNLLLLFIILFHTKLSIASSKQFDEACYQKVQGNVCLPMTNNHCMHGTLSYLSTTTIFTNLSSIMAVRNALGRWNNLHKIPKCWDVVRQLLCAVYLPKCRFEASGNFSMIQLPSREVCEVSRAPCSLLDNLWPDYLRCEHPSFVRRCLVTALFNISNYLNFLNNLLHQGKTTIFCITIIKNKKFHTSGV